MSEEYEEEVTLAMAELTPQELTQQRKSTHGDWKDQSYTTRRLKDVVESMSSDRLTPSHREAIDMICVKIGRILCGDPNEPDHWLDIAGYAHLGKGGHNK